MKNSKKTFCLYYEEWINVYKKGAVRNVTYKKYLLTLDMDLEADYEGIIKINVIDWLLKQDK